MSSAQSAVRVSPFPVFRWAAKGVPPGGTAAAAAGASAGGGTALQPGTKAGRGTRRVRAAAQNKVLPRGEAARKAPRSDLDARQAAEHMIRESHRLPLVPDLNKKLWFCPFRRKLLYGIKKKIRTVACPSFRPEKSTGRGSRSSAALGAQVHADVDRYIRGKINGEPVPVTQLHKWAQELIHFEEKTLGWTLAASELVIFSKTKQLASQFDHCAVDTQTNQLVLVSLKTGYNQTWDTANCFFLPEKTNLKRCRATPCLQSWFQLGLEAELIQDTYGVTVDRMVILIHTGNPLAPVKMCTYPTQVFGAGNEHRFWKTLYSHMK